MSRRFVTAIYFCFKSAGAVDRLRRLRFESLGADELASASLSDGTYTVTYSGEALKLLKVTASVFFHFRN